MAAASTPTSALVCSAVLCSLFPRVYIPWRFGRLTKKIPRKTRQNTQSFDAGFGRGTKYLKSVIVFALNDHLAT